MFINFVPTRSQAAGCVSVNTTDESGLLDQQQFHSIYHV